MTIRTENQAREAADQYANKAIEINELKAQFATAENDLKIRKKQALAQLTKDANSIKNKVKRFVLKSAKKFFGKDTGSCKTQQSEIKLRNNPPKLKKIDPTMTDETLITRAKQQGLSHVVVTHQVISKEALERLTEAELERLGYYKEATQTFDIIPLAEPKAKTSSRIAS